MRRDAVLHESNAFRPAPKGWLETMLPMHHSRQDIGKQTGSTLPLPMRTEFRVPGLLKKAAEKFAAVQYTQFLIHMCAVRFHRIFADDQGGGNLPIALAAQEEFAQAVGFPSMRLKS